MARTQFGALLLGERTGAGHTQVEAARLSGVSRPAINALERTARKPDVETFIRLAAVYPALIYWLIARIVQWRPNGTKNPPLSEE